MIVKIKTARCLLMLIGCAFLYLMSAHPFIAQEGSKGIRAEEVLERPDRAKRTKPTTRTTTNKPVAAPKSRRPVTYRSSKIFTNKPAPQGMEYAQVGVTIWRLQMSGDSKGLEQQGEEAQLEQIEADTTLNIGSKVRISIESLTHDGFLYVIDREQFADGSYGAARLIFPTLRTRKGNNRVRAHELVLIPRPPSYFNIEPSSTGIKQMAEILTIIISPVRLNLPAPLAARALTLDANQVKDWEKQWRAAISTLEMEGGAGQTVSVKTQAEGAKSLDQEGEEAETLTNDDPLPQTVYRATIKKGDALLVTVPLRFGPGSAGAQN